MAAGKRSVEKKMPEKIHIGTITRFMSPDTPSMVLGRAAVSSPRPLKARAPSSDTAESSSTDPRMGTSRTR